MSGEVQPRAGGGAHDAVWLTLLALVVLAALALSTVLPGGPLVITILLLGVRAAIGISSQPHAGVRRALLLLAGLALLVQLTFLLVLYSMSAGGGMAGPVYTITS